MIVRLVAAATLTLSGSALAQAPASLNCTTTFTKTADEASLAKMFGRANVVTATLKGAEGSTERGTVVFPNDPNRRIEVFWHDTARRRRPATVRVRDRSTWAVRPSSTADRELAVGTILGEVASVNGRPFTVSGFGWDMGGYATDWKGGTLDKIDGGCFLSVRFNPDPKVTGRALDRASGDKQLSSADAVVKAVRPVVSELALSWPE